MPFEAESLFSLEGKRALVTGATGHLGRVITDTLIANGAEVIALYHKSDNLTAAACNYQFDMYASEGYPALRAFAADNPVDVLVNNAHEMSQETGFNIPEDQLEEYDPMHAYRNYVGGYAFPAVLTSYFGAGMKKSGWGSIINICTMYAKVSPSPILYRGTNYANPPHYGASKAALLQFTRYVASYWGRFGVRCNAILPGPFPKSKKDSIFMGKLAERTSLGRVGEKEELAGAVLWLASNASSYVTGAEIAVDGGWTSL